MNVSGDMHEYSSTEEFLKAFQKHFKIISTCDNSNLEKCWPSRVINVPNSNGTYTEKSVSTITNGTNLKALALGTKNTTTMGIITGDGVPMILVFAPNCVMSEGAGSTWSMVDGKPETNSSTACVSAVFDINGGAGPNKLGMDVRTINSLFGSVDLGTGYNKLENSDCPKLKKKLGIKECRTDNGNDYWGGAVKACNDLHLHLPSMTTLATAAGSIWGVSDLGLYDCINYSSCPYGTNRTLTKDSNTSVSLTSGSYWSSSEISATNAWVRVVYSSYTGAHRNNRNNQNRALCVGYEKKQLFG